MNRIVLKLPRRLAPRTAERKRRRAAYALPTLFTAGNAFLGFFTILESFQGALLTLAGAAGANLHFEHAALAIGWAVLLDGLDGRIARITNTVSDFGRELDSLADVITFGLAPAVLAFTWGIHFAGGADMPFLADHLNRLGYFIGFLYLLCGAARLARFNIQVNPIPKNPGRPDRKYFVGLPIPAAAAMIAAVVHAADARPIRHWILALGWLGLLALLSFLMVSTWRYRSFKDFQLLRPRSWVSVVAWGSLIVLILLYSQPALLGLAAMYVGSGIVIRLGGAVRRFFRRPPALPEHPLA